MATHKQYKILYIILAIIVLWMSLPVSNAIGQDYQKLFARKLAIMHARHQDPESFLGKTVEPQDATIREFLWILNTLETRCTNTPEEIATILVRAWQLVRNRGYDISLLTTSRKLNRYARNTELFGVQPVALQKVAGLWTKTHMP